MRSKGVNILYVVPINRYFDEDETLSVFFKICWAKKSYFKNIICDVTEKISFLLKQLREKFETWVKYQFLQVLSL